MSIRELVPEARLLYLLLDEDRTDDEIAVLLEERLEWGYFCWLVAQEKAVSVVYDRLHSFPEGLVPSAVLKVLMRQALVMRFRMNHLEERLSEILAALRGAGIEVLLLKGAALGATVYTSFGDRPMADLDLLVPEARGAEAWELAQRLGWRLDGFGGMDDFYADHHHYPPLVDGSGMELGLDLHTSLLASGHPFELPLDRVWERAVPVPALGQGVYVLDPATQLLHLCLHFGWSNMLTSGGWRTFRDLGMLLASGQTDWDEFVELASTARARTCAYWVLRLASTAGGVGVPVAVLARLAPPGSDPLLRALERHYLLRMARVTEVWCPSARVNQVAWMLGIRPGWSGHGASRPWQRNSVFLAELTEEERAARGATEITLGARIWRHAANLRGWSHYLRFVTGGGAPGWQRSAASRSPISANFGRSASASSESTSPAR